MNTDPALLQPGASLITLVLEGVWRDGGSRCGWFVGWDTGSATACWADVVDAFLELADECAVGGLGALFLERWGGRAGALVEGLGVETHWYLMMRMRRLGGYFREVDGRYLGELDTGRGILLGISDYSVTFQRRWQTLHSYIRFPFRDSGKKYGTGVESDRCDGTFFSVG